MLKHTHKYQRVRNKGVHGEWTIYRCMKPGCNHFLPTPGLLEGKVSECWICKDDFIIDKKSMHQARPVCRECAEDRADRKERLINGV